MSCVCALKPCGHGTNPISRGRIVTAFNNFDGVFNNFDGVIHNFDEIIGWGLPYTACDRLLPQRDGSLPA